MAILTIAKSEADEALKYVEKSDLAKLVHYCCTKSIRTYVNLLYDFNDYNVYTAQMLYHQDCKGEGLHTRALHFVLSVEEWELKGKNKLEEIKSIAFNFCGYTFQKHQSICCIHNDKPGRYDIHYIVNPVNAYNFKIHHWSSDEFFEWIRNVAYILYSMNLIAIQNFTWIDENNKLRQGTSVNLYEQKIRLF